MTQMMYYVFVSWSEFKVYYVSFWGLGDGLYWQMIWWRNQVSISGTIIEAFPSLRLSGKPGCLPSQEKQALDKEIRGKKVLWMLWGCVSRSPQLRGDSGPAGLGWVRDLVVLMQGRSGEEALLKGTVWMRGKHGMSRSSLPGCLYGFLSGPLAGAS